MTETSRRRAHRVDAAQDRNILTALRASSVLAVLAIVWQGATAGGILMRHLQYFEFHQVGAIVVHVLTGLVVVAAFMLERETRGPRWPLVLAGVVFAASFVQAALGDDETMWAHVPGALLLMLGSAAVLVWALLHRRLTR